MVKFWAPILLERNPYKRAKFLVDGLAVTKFGKMIRLDKGKVSGVKL